MFDLIVLLTGRKPQKVTRFGADPTVKASWRFVRSWICHNHKAYYTYVIACSFVVYQFWWYTCVGYYKRRNHERSLEWAIQKEAEWDLMKPKEEEYDEEDYGEEGAEVAEAAAEDAEEDEE